MFFRKRRDFFKPDRPTVEELRARRRKSGNLFLQPCVYFMQGENGGPIKIGQTSRKVSERLAAIQANCAVRLRILGIQVCWKPEVLERRLHARFDAARIWYEWFSPTDELLAYIAERAKPPETQFGSFIVDPRTLGDEDDSGG